MSEAALTILGLSGSSRTRSISHLALNAALEGARERGARTVMIELADLSLPLFEEEAAVLPIGARRLRELAGTAQALVIAAPEVNGSYAPALANALAWLGPLALKEKPIGLVGASMGDGAVKALNALSLTLSYMGALVLPNPIAVCGGAAAFGADGKLADSRLDGRVRDVGRAVAQFLVRR